MTGDLSQVRGTEKISRGFHDKGETEVKRRVRQGDGVYRRNRKKWTDSGLREKFYSQSVVEEVLQTGLRGVDSTYGETRR